MHVIIDKLEPQTAQDSAAIIKKVDGGCSNVLVRISQKFKAMHKAKCNPHMKEPSHKVTNCLDLKSFTKYDEILAKYVEHQY